jgi:hypothetical protein
MWCGQRDRAVLSLAILVSKFSAKFFLPMGATRVQRRVLSGVLVVSINSISKSGDVADMSASPVAYNA